jgi:hypothetical protein
MPTASENIFRQVTLDRLSSPEQLDRLITLTSPAGWAALAALAVLLPAAILADDTRSNYRRACESGTQSLRLARTGASN